MQVQASEGGRYSPPARQDAHDGLGEDHDNWQLIDTAKIPKAGC